MGQHQLRPRQPGWNCWRAGDEPLGPPVHSSRRTSRSLSRKQEPHKRSREHDRERSQRRSYDGSPSDVSPSPRPMLIARPPSETGVGPRYKPGTGQEPGQYYDQDAEENIVEELPQLWSPALDTLMRQTSRAYDLVLAYARDAEGGLRWYASDIPRVREAGKHLHRDMWALRRRQRTMKYHGDPHMKMKRQIEQDAQRMWDLCKKVQGVIAELEQKNEHELLGTGKFEADERGNIVKVSEREVRDGMRDGMRGRMRDGMYRRGGRAGAELDQGGRNDDAEASPSLFYIDTEPRGIRRRPSSDSSFRARSSSPKFRAFPQRAETGQRSRQQHEFCRSRRNDLSRPSREGSYMPRRYGSSRGPGMLGKHTLHF